MSTHATPIVPTILFIADQRHPWRLAALTRHDVTYHTPTTVRTRDSGTLTQTHVYCLENDAAWGRVQATQAALQQQLDALADGLRELGSYASRLAVWGGVRQAPNPLCATVISASDPDNTDESYSYLRLIPQITRQAISGHTPKMLRGKSGYYDITFSQRDKFVCEDDAAWERIDLLRQNAQDAAQAWEQLLRELGTYQAALADGRYARKEAPMQQTLASQPASLLAGTEQEALRRCEAIIERGVQTFIEVGEALAEIRDGKLYRAGYGTFDDYCRERWGIGRGRAYQLMDAATVTREMSTVVDNPPKTEREARAVAKAAPADRGRVLDRADQLAGSNERTAKHIDQAAEEIGAPPADFDDAKRRFARLGWNLEKHGVWWKLSAPDGTHYATAAPAPQLRTLATFEAGAAKRALAAKPATCDRCGAERTESRHLTSYQAGLIDAYPGRDVTLCSRCIPELLAAQRDAAVEADRQRRGLPPVPSTAELVDTRFPEQPKIPEVAPQAPITAAPLTGWWACGTELRAISTAIGQGDRLAATRAALHLAVVLIGDALDDYADQMPDAMYEALARLVRKESQETHHAT